MTYHIFQKDHKCRGAGNAEEDPCSQGIEYQGDDKEDAVQIGEHRGCHTGIPNTHDRSVWQAVVHLLIFGGPLGDEEEEWIMRLRFIQWND